MTFIWEGFVGKGIEAEKERGQRRTGEERETGEETPPPHTHTHTRCCKEHGGGRMGVGEEEEGREMMGVERKDRE
jgi:hypothetical protein